MKQTLDPVAEARGQYERWLDEVAMLEAEVAAGEETMGARAFLEPKSLGDSARALAERRDQLDGARSALEHARGRLAEQERSATVAEIVRLRTKAEEAFEAADRHEVRTRAMLAKLAEHEQVEAWSDQPAAYLDKSLRWRTPHTASARLRSDGRKLLKAADDLEAKLHAVKNFHYVLDDLADPDGFVFEYRGR